MKTTTLMAQPTMPNLASPNKRLGGKLCYYGVSFS